jgi:hypothetical protein
MCFNRSRTLCSARTSRNPSTRAAAFPAMRTRAELRSRRRNLPGEAHPGVSPRSQGRGCQHGFRPGGPNPEPNWSHQGHHISHLPHPRVVLTRSTPSSTRARQRQGATAAGFWTRAHTFFAAHNIDVERILTDNGSCYRSRDFAAALNGIVHSRTRPCTLRLRGDRSAAGRFRQAPVSLVPEARPHPR